MNRAYNDRMQSPCPATWFRLLGCSLACSALAGGGCAGRPASDPFANWSRLQLEARAGPLFSGRVEMSLHAGPGGRVLETDSSARFLGATLAQSRTETVLDDETGRTSRYSAFSSRRGRRYSFGTDGYSFEKLARQHGGGDDGPWEPESTKEFRYPVEDGRPVAVHDYFGMLLRLPALRLERPGDEARIWVATGDGPRRFVVQVAESRDSERSFTDLATGAKRTVSLVEFRLRLTPDDQESDEGFLSMEGETEVWVESRSKTPIEISGKIPRVPGRVRLTLDAIG